MRVISQHAAAQALHFSRKHSPQAPGPTPSFPFSFPTGASRENGD